MSHKSAITALLAAASLSSCSLAPHYHRPEMQVPQGFKEAPGDWRQAAPEKAALSKGPWWQAYHNEGLNALESKVASANQDLKAALARYDEARAVARQARAGYFPTVSAEGSAMRERLSTTVGEVRASKPFNDVTVALDFSYELDLWGRVRNSVKADESRAAASAADLAAMDLSLHGELAMDYFSLRGLDAQQMLVDETVIAYEKALKLTQARHTGGAAPAVDVDRAETQWQTARTLAADTALKRAQFEHAIAVLVGEMPSGFSLKNENTAITVPPPAPVIASSLLEQRPDIAASELRVQAANADIGVARAAYYPAVSLGAQGGTASALLSKLVNAPSLIWSFGPSITAPLFDGGRIAALSDQAHAAYEEAVASYRQTVLSAFQQVEDSLAALRRLESENTTQSAAVAASQRALKQAGDRYSGGIATYLDVVETQSTALQAELSLIDIRTRQLQASVALTKAVGGFYQAPGPSAPTAPAGK